MPVVLDYELLFVSTVIGLGLFASIYTIKLMVTDLVLRFYDKYNNKQ